MKLLHIDSSILGAHSASRAVTRDIVQGFWDAHPHLEVLYRDLSLTPLAHMTRQTINPAHPMSAQDDPSLADERARGDDALAEFLNADVVVIGAPMYNFTIPSQLKAWVDRICVPGKTFSYGADGPKGLAGNKRVIIAVTRGGDYRGDDRKAFEHTESYLRATFGFLGVSPEIIALDGLATAQRNEAVESAGAAVRALAR